MPRLRNIVYLTEAQKQTLFSTGTITVGGQTITYSDNDIYIVPQLWNIDGSASDNLLIKDNTNATRLTLSNSGVVTASGFSGSGSLITLTSTPVTPANGDYLIISDASNSSRLSKSIEIGSGTTTFLRNDGTWATPPTGLTGTGTANQLTYWVGTSELGSLTTATYPSLTELSYVKGVTSAIQTQLDGKVNTTAVGAVSGVASLGSDGKIPVGQLPNSVFDNLNYVAAISDLSGVYGGYFNPDNKVLDAISFAFYIVEPTGLKPLHETARQISGVYYVASGPLTLKNIPSAIQGVNMPLHQTAGTTIWTSVEIISGDGNIGTGDQVLEVGDWFVINRVSAVYLDSTAGTEGNPYNIQISIVNNTYENASTTVDGIVRLSSQNTYASLSGNNVVTDGVLKTVIDNANFAGSSHTHLLAAGATDVTATAAELNVLDGITATTAELNFTDGVTSAIQTQLNAKAADNAVVKLTGNQTVAGIKTFTSQLQSGLQGNIAGGNIRLGVTTDAITKYGFITGTHYSSTAEPEGISIIGLVSSSTENNVMIGGHIYEANPATSIQFYTNPTTTNATGGLERMRITSDGNLGIGTTNPGYKLDVRGDSASRVTLANFVNNTNAAGTEVALRLSHTNNPPCDVNLVSKRMGADTGADFYIELSDGSTGADVERFRITESGNVGIGITNPSANLEVVSAVSSPETGNGILRFSTATGTEDRGNKIGAVSGSSGYSYWQSIRPGVANDGIISLNPIGGNVGIGTSAPLNKLDVRITGGDSNNGIMITREDTTTTTNEILGGIGFDSTDGNVPSSVLEASAYIAAFAAEDHSVGDKGGYLTFGTSPIDQDDDTVSSERMRITSEGNVGIGTTSPSTRLSINAIAATGTRENILDATVSDDINSRFIISNGTITDGVFAPSFGGISNSTIHWGLKFTGFTTAANDASNSSNFGLVDFEVLRTDSTTNPFNGTLSNVVNRRAFTFRNGTSNLMTIMSSGNVGIGTNAPGELLDVRGNLRVGGSSTSNYIAFHGTTGDNPAGFNHGYIGERIFSGTESSELVIFKGNDVEGAPGPDRIRHIAANHLFDTYGSALSGTFAEVSASSVPTTKMIITQVGNVGIGTTTPSALLTVNNGESNGAFAVQSLATNDYIATFRDSDGENVFKASGSVADSDLVVAFGDVNDAGSAVNYKILSDKHVFSGSVGIGTSSSALSDTLTVNGSAKVGSLKIDDIHVQDTATVTTTATTQTVLATYAVATYATGKFMIQATSGGNRHISELLVTHNGTVSTATEYAILKTAGNLFTVTTDISGGNVRILVTSASATSTVYRTTFTLIGV